MASDPSPLYSKVTGSLLSLACSVLSVCVPPLPLLIICAAGVIRSPHETRPAEIHALQKDAEKVFQAVDSRYNDKHTALWPEKSLQPTYYFKKLSVMHLQTLTQWKTWGDSFKFATTWSLLAFAVLIISAISFFFEAGFLLCSYFIRQRMIRRLKTTLLALMTIIIYTLAQAAQV